MNVFWNLFVFTRGITNVRVFLRSLREIIFFTFLMQFCVTFWKTIKQLHLPSQRTPRKQPTEPSATWAIDAYFHSSFHGLIVEFNLSVCFGPQTYDVSNKIACLQPVWISKASSKQRRGRAGRYGFILLWLSCSKAD